MVSKYSEAWRKFKLIASLTIATYASLGCKKENLEKKVQENLKPAQPAITKVVNQPSQPYQTDKEIETEKQIAKPSLITKQIPKIENIVNYKTTDFSENDLRIINYTAKRVGADARLLMAIRKAENGREGLEFGIIPNERYNQDKGIIENGKLRDYENEFEKQCSWCAWTIKRNRERFNQNPSGSRDFIDYLQKVYCPIGADNDKDGLNQNWQNNVRAYFDKYSKN